MANPYRAEVEVTIGGKLRKLVFNANAIAAIETETGEGVFALAEKLGEGAGAPMTSILRVMLWAGLSEASRKKVTIHNVGRSMRIDEYEQYATECMRGLLRAYGEDLDEVTARAEDADPLGPGEDAEKENPLQTHGEELTSEPSDEKPSLPASDLESSGD